MTSQSRYLERAARGGGSPTKRAIGASSKPAALSKHQMRASGETEVSADLGRETSRRAKAGRGSAAPHAVARTRRRRKAGVSDRPLRRPAGRRRGGPRSGDVRVGATSVVPPALTLTRACCSDRSRASRPLAIDRERLHDDRRLRAVVDHQPENVRAVVMAGRVKQSLSGRQAAQIQISDQDPALAHGGPARSLPVGATMTE